jgi:hypothetical protein
MPQGKRNRVLQDLRSRHLRVLVATDVAARGIDVPTISHVINHGLPMKPEDYIHRIGRTGRAGRNGLAITLAERRDVGMIRRIERFTTQPIAVSVVVGLEPKYTAPTMSGPSGSGFAGKPGFGSRGRPSFGGPRADRGNDRSNFGGGGSGGFNADRRPAGNFGGASGGGYRSEESRPQGGHRDEGHSQAGFRDNNRPQGGFRDGAPQGGFREGGFRNDSRSQAPRGNAGPGGFSGGNDRPAREGFGGGDRPDRPAFGAKPAFGPRRTPR